MRRAILVLLLLLISSVHASADCYGSETTLCSQIFYGSGVCDGTDQVPILERPWEPVAIEIVGVTVGLKIWGAGERGYIFAGNSYSPDVMLFHVGEGSETVMFPKGLSFYLPPKAAHVDASVHVDEHVLCWGDKAYYAWLVIYYTLKR